MARSERGGAAKIKSPSRPASAADKRRRSGGSRKPTSSGRPPREGKRRAKRSSSRRRGSALGFVLRAGLVLSLLCVLALGAVIAYYAATLPPRAEWAVPERPPNVAILSDAGELIGNRGDTGGRAVSLEELPPYVGQAVIAIEDRRFHGHFGVDPIGLARAMVANLRAGGLVQGGSTLTQQLAKNLFLDPSRTLERKIQEMIFSVWLELEHDKDEILEMYLNRVYYGAGAYGIDAAARRYFGKGAEELELAEAALLAGVLKAPAYFGPTVNLSRANERAATVLRAMREAGFINELQEAFARQNPAVLRAPDVATSGGYVADWVAGVLPRFIGTAGEDIVVETTIDLELQQLAQAALQELLETEGAEKNVGQGAVVVLDAGGAVKALVGGRQYGDSQYNRAVAAHRQPGSAFKPFVYLAALEDGLSPETMRIDQPTQIGNWTPENYNRQYYGPVSLTRALAHSLNTIAAQLTSEVGPARVAETARRLGIESPLASNASIALGTSEVTLLELTAAYVPFSNGGVGVSPHVVRRIETADGLLIYERRTRAEQVVSQEDVGAMNHMLSAALTSGTAQRAQLPGWPAAGKTGTSQNWRDAWFVGYTAYFTAGVWLGNDDNAPTDRTTGGTLPAALWRTLMEAVHAGMVPAELPGAEPAPSVIAARDVPQDQPWNAAPAARNRGAAEGNARLAPPPAPGGIGGFLRNLFDR